jgi:hypothetical protein
MLDPTLWKSRFTVIYNNQARGAFDLRWLMTSRLTRIDITTTREIKATWNKGGDLLRLSDRVQVGKPRYISWGSSYQIWPADGFYPYQFQWRPVPWFPVGKIQFWEYTGAVSHADLVRLAQASGDTDTLLSLSLEAFQMIITNPSGSNTNATQKVDFKQDIATAVEVIPANALRNGGTILNQGKSKLYLGFGIVADKGSKFIVLPGGQAEIQDNFIGPVNAIWDAIDATPNNSSKAIFIEFVA